MKKITWAVMLATTISTAAFAEMGTSQRPEIATCSFSSGAQDQGESVRCEATLTAPSSTPTMTVTVRPPAERNVRLDVECTNRFRLTDPHAVLVEKGPDEFTIGTQGGRIALLEIFNVNVARQPAFTRDATLIISSSHKRTLRLTGQCDLQDDAGSR
jgi:hypothetical protein